MPRLGFVILLSMAAFSTGLVAQTVMRDGKIIPSGSTLPSTCTPNQTFVLTIDPAGTYRCNRGGTWDLYDTLLTPVTSGGGGAIPTGAILLIISGTCPSGFVEETALNSKTLVGTIAANANIGTTGGADSVTPAGTNAAPTFTGSALSSHSHGVGTLATSAHTGTAVADHAAHTHTVTAAGTEAWPATVPTFTGAALATHAHELPFQKVTGGTGVLRMLDPTIFGTGTSRAAISQSAAPTANTTSAAVLKSQAITAGTPSGTIAWPASVPTFTGSSVISGNPSATLMHAVTQPSAHTLSGSSSSDSAGTPAGTVSAPTFTGTAFDNRSAFTRVIFCRKT